MKNKNSLLLPPQFFETDSDEKIRNILDLDVDALYLFDHFKNPTDSSKPTYKFTEEIFSLYKKVKNEIEVGVCVLNVNARDSNILFKDIIDPLLELKNINIGLGTGDNKYEKHVEIFDNEAFVLGGSMSSEPFDLIKLIQSDIKKRYKFPSRTFPEVFIASQGELSLIHI